MTPKHHWPPAHIDPLEGWGRLDDVDETHVRAEETAATIAAYDADAAAYAVGTAGMTAVRTEVEDFAARLPAGSIVLEIGSGPGRDARWLEECGLRVRRTDVTPAFVTMMRSAGFEADLLDPLTDALVDEDHAPYDAVWCSASLLHVARADLPTVLTRLRLASRDAGLLYLTLKEGDGEAWSTHGHVTAPRHFTYWREGPLREVLTDTGWHVVEVRRSRGPRDDWLDVVASAVGPRPGDGS